MGVGETGESALSKRERKKSEDGRHRGDGSEEERHRGGWFSLKKCFASGRYGSQDLRDQDEANGI